MTAIRLRIGFERQGAKSKVKPLKMLTASLSVDSASPRSYRGSPIENQLADIQVSRFNIHMARRVVGRSRLPRRRRTLM